MKNSELAELAFNSLRYRSLRSWLAILGIVIGVASIISLISISVGINDSIQTNLGGLGANVITISPGALRADRLVVGGGAQFGAPSSASSAKLTLREADELRGIAGVSKLDARITGNARVNYRNKNTSISIIGTEPSAFPQSAANTILYGRTLAAGELSSAVLGYSVAASTFNESMLNKQIKINGVPFRVVGVLNQSGSSFSGTDRSIFISQKAAQKLFSENKYASSIIVVAADGSNPDTVAAALTQKLLTLHRVSAEKQDFSITTATTLQSTISSVTNTLAIFLGGIASISLIVGGIGVANAMFTSVLEQTKYIGLLKSLGTRRGTVMKLFLFEACMVGLVGGIIGIVLSFAASAVLGGFGLPTRITPDLVLLGLGFSILIGAISGLVPARNAASVPPVEALRYE